MHGTGAIYQAFPRSRGVVPYLGAHVDDALEAELSAHSSLHIDQPERVKNHDNILCIRSANMPTN